jgi:hypothetical protein
LNSVDEEEEAYNKIYRRTAVGIVEKKVSPGKSSTLKLLGSTSRSLSSFAKKDKGPSVKIVDFPIDGTVTHKNTVVNDTTGRTGTKSSAATA